MINVICKQNCREPYCEPVCPVGALLVRSKTVYVDSDKCHGCGLCRKSCVTWSVDKALGEKTLDWMMGR